MKKNFTFLIICFILNTGFCINQAFSADTYIHITEEGIIGIESILQDGKYYKLTETIRKPIVIEINDIILDGDGHRLELTYSEDGIMITGQSGITIQNLRISSSNEGIILRDASECIIKNNTVERCRNKGIVLMESSTFNTISGNTITGNGGEGINIIENSDSNTIVGNTLTENDSDEIYIEGSSNQIIYGNIVIGGPGEGIETGNSNNNKIFLNSVTQSHSGIQIKGPGTNNLIFKNMLIQNDYGIRVERSNDNRIYENEIVFNEFSGIGVDFSTNNHFYNNEIYYNSRGIDFFQAEQNFVYNNNFVENINQASFDPEINSWYFDYTIGGNYWSDYEGVDEDNNGFGDEPKVLRSFTIDYKIEIDEENLDKMPLMQPKQINAGKEPSSITCVVSPESVTEGATITISGELTRAYDYPIPNEETEITLTIEKPSGLPDSHTFVITDGKYEDEYETEMPGSYFFSVTWEGNIFYEGSVSEEFEFFVEEEVPPPKKTLLSIPEFDSSFVSGEDVKVSGKLTTDNDEGIPDANVILQLYIIDVEVGSVNIVKTDSTGYYEYSYTIDEEGGPYKVGVKYEGLEPYYLGTSEVLSRGFQISSPEPEPEPSIIKGGFPYWILLLLLIIVAVVYYYYRRSQEQQKE